MFYKGDTLVHDGCMVPKNELQFVETPIRIAFEARMRRFINYVENKVFAVRVSPPVGYNWLDEFDEFVRSESGERV